jgi:hypothetical protein
VQLKECKGAEAEAMQKMKIYHVYKPWATSHYIEATVIMTALLRGAD